MSLYNTIFVAQNTVLGLGLQNIWIPEGRIWNAWLLPISSENIVFFSTYSQCQPKAHYWRWRFYWNFDLDWLNGNQLNRSALPSKDFWVSKSLVLSGCLFFVCSPHDPRVQDGYKFSSQSYAESKSHNQYNNNKTKRICSFATSTLNQLNPLISYISNTVQTNFDDQWAVQQLLWN